MPHGNAIWFSPTLNHGIDKMSYRRIPNSKANEIKKDFVILVDLVVIPQVWRKDSRNIR